MDRKAEDAYVYDQGQLDMLFKLVANQTIDINTAAKNCEMPKEEFEKKYLDAGYGKTEDIR